ncbi:MAG TPA: thioredoxin domain-containing protein [Solirubrobacteraceae bacterium]|nr:thioredoxin domain-containing protein [Solirubrobacteraceae bacterium]
MPNRLARETSPYLLQHRDNPVDWYPWGPEALERARAQDRPLLVSIGYSACHWCHVMAHESFEDPEVAALMNERFVCIKVDREERPDVDAMCMEAAQAMTGHGGWPLNAFLSPDLVPFFAGTYFPPEPRQGLPSWRMVLLAVSDAWRERREEISRQGEEIMRSLNATARLEPSTEAIREEPLTDAVALLVGSHDSAHGGWGSAPKFPQASVIELLLARGEAEVATAALEAMAEGGIYDHVGGGFARYSVDATWTVPHFEKMLYDNGLLARAYLHGWQVSGRERLRRVCTETLDWALREMRGPEGGFYSALDADSEGVEGKFYVWTEDELRQVLGPLYEEAVAYFGPRPFEAGAKVLEGRGPEPERLPEIRCQLYGARSERVRPGTDDKRLTAWNALMISALADAGAVLGRDDYLDAAVGCADFLLARGRVRTDHIPAFLDDHAYLLEALLTLYESTFEPRWYREAVATADTMIERFGDPERGGFFTTAEGQSELPVRRKDLEDSPIPSGNSSAGLGLLRLAALSGQRRYEEQALGVLRLLFGVAARHPLAFGHLLRAADFYLASVREVAIVGPEPGADALVGVVREQLRPHLVLAGGAGDGVPLLEGRGPVDGQAAAYVCEHFACQAPVTRPDELRAMLTAAPTAA